MERPKTGDLVDLHVFVVPIESWVGKYSVAYNNVALQSTSAGFIRVDPHANLLLLRKWMMEQLDSTILPEEFVILRSVGRCMAVVNQNQETNLKAKHFLPPIAFSPEIFILQGTHEWIASLRGQTESIIVNTLPVSQDGYIHRDSSSYEMSNHNPYTGQFNSEYNQSEESFEVHDGKEENQAESPEISEHVSNEVEPAKEAMSEGNSSEILAEAMLARKGHQRFSEVLKSKRPRSQKPIPSMSPRGPSDSNNEDILQSETREGNRNSKNKQMGADSPKKNLPALQNSKVPSIQLIHPEILTHPTPIGRLNTPTPIPSANVVHSTLKYNYVDNRSLNQKTEMEAQHPLSTTVSNNKDRIEGDPNAVEFDEQENVNNEDLIEEDRKAAEFDEQENVNNEDLIEEDRKAVEFDEQENVNNDEFMDNQATGSEDNLPLENKAALSKVKDSDGDIEKIKNVSNGNSLDLAINNRYGTKPKLPLRSAKDEVKKEEERKRLEEEKKKMMEMKRSMDDDTLKLMQDMEALLQKKKGEEEKRRLEEEQRRKLAKEDIESKKKEVAKLEKEFLKVKQDRLEMQKQRERFLKEAKEVKHKVAAKKSPDKNTWKQKYLDEKQRSVFLEEERNAIKADIADQQKKLLEGLEGKGTFVVDVDKTSSRMVMGPSQLNNLKNEVRRLMNEAERLNTDIDRTSNLLAAESKKKMSAQKQLKELRNELNEKRKPASFPRTERDLIALQKKNNVKL